MKNFQFSISNFQDKGFTLIETMVAITILILSVTGAFSAVQTGLSSGTFSKQEIVAYYLAQEGVEEIRNVRDRNGLNGSNWLTGLAANQSDPCYFGKVCSVDAPTDTIANVSSALKQDDASGLYGYSNSYAITTPFTRSITLTQISNDEVSVSVTIAWSKGTNNRSFTVRENIMNWQ